MSIEVSLPTPCSDKHSHRQAQVDARRYPLAVNGVLDPANAKMPAENGPRILRNRCQVGVWLLEGTPTSGWVISLFLESGELRGDSYGLRSMSKFWQ